jgi:4-nitrophenyl phosphatase
VIPGSRLAGLDTIVCDIDGVVLRGRLAVPGAKEALDRLRDADLELLFVTNNSTKTGEHVAERLREVVGFETTAAKIATSAGATARYVADRATVVYVVGTDGLRETLRIAGLTVTADWREADSVVCGMDFEVTYPALAEATLAVQHGAAFFATNSDATYPAEDGLYPGAGALVAVIERATGKSPIVCGKPFLPMRRLLDGLAGDKTLIIGDRPDTDIALGMAQGWYTVLVLTGVVAAAVEVPPELRADATLESIAGLPELLGLD